MYVIVGTLPPLGFTPLYLSTEYIDKYNRVLFKLGKEMGFDICDLDDLPTEFLVDGCHFTHDGNLEVVDLKVVIYKERDEKDNSYHGGAWTKLYKVVRH